MESTTPTRTRLSHLPPSPGSPSLASATALASALARQSTTRNTAYALLASHRTRHLLERSLTDKGAIVLDIGQNMTRCGFAGEALPRHIILTPKMDPKWTDERLDDVIRSYLHNIFFKLLLITPSERRVVFCENYAAPGRILSRIAHILYSVYKVPSMINLPSPALPLYPITSPTALVIDCGYSEVRVFPVCNGSPIVSAWCSAPIGGQAVDQSLRASLLGSGVIEKGMETRPVSDNDITVTLLEQIKTQHCFIPPMKVTQDSPDVSCGRLRIGGGETLVVSGDTCEQAACNILFEGADDEGRTIQSLACHAIIASPIDYRVDLCANVIVCGGTALMHGLRTRLAKELTGCVEVAKATGKLGKRCAVDVKVSGGVDVPADCLVWLGGSIFGALDFLVTTKYTSKESYLATQILPSAYQ